MSNSSEINVKRLYCAVNFSLNFPKIPVTVTERAETFRFQETRTDSLSDSWDDCGFNGPFCGQVLIPNPNLPFCTDSRWTRRPGAQQRSYDNMTGVCARRENNPSRPVRAVCKTRTKHTHSWVHTCTNPPVRFILATPVGLCTGHQSLRRKKTTRTLIRLEDILTRL